MLNLRWLYFKVFGERPPRRSPRKARRGPPRDPIFRSWIRKQPSVLSGRMGCEAAHTGDDGGMGLKPSDYSCIPLTPAEHREYHRIGRRAFEGRHQIDLDCITESLTSEFWSSRRAA